MDAKPYEVILTGRLSRIPELFSDISSLNERKQGLRCRGPVNVFAKRAKDVAMGAALIANGVGGGKYAELLECLEISPLGRCLTMLESRVLTPMPY